MANKLTTNPVYLDTFAADVTIFSDTCHPKVIVMNSDTAGDKLVFNDLDGNVVAIISVDTADQTAQLWLPETEFQSKGLVFDLSASAIAGTVTALIYA